MAAALMVLAAGLLWGIVSLFTRPMGELGLSALETSGVRSMLGAPLLALVLLVKDKSLLRIKLRDIWMFVGTGVVSFFFFNFLYFQCMELSEVSVAVILLYTSPVWLMFFGRLLFKERFTTAKIVALCLPVSGCVLVSGVLGGAVTLTPAALLCGLASGFFYALYSVFGTIALKKYNPFTVTFYSFLCAAVAAVFVSNPGHAIQIAVQDPAAILIYLGLTVVSSVTPYILYNSGLQHLEASQAGILATAEPMMGCILGIFAYGESATPLKIIGIALIIAALVISGLKPNKNVEGASRD